jgi:hypothetical protein
MNGSVSLINGHVDRPTNYERIKNMSFEEMANAIYQICYDVECILPTVKCLANNCDKCIRTWLESEVDAE